MQMLPRWHSQAVCWSFLVPLYPQPTLPRLSSRAYSPALRARPCGQWVLFNNKLESFLCPGNVPLAIRAVLISRPQRSQGRPRCAQDTWDISAKCFLHFVPPALKSKHDLYGWNSIRSSLRFPSGEMKVAPAKPIVSPARRQKCCFLARPGSRRRWDGGEGR